RDRAGRALRTQEYVADRDEAARGRAASSRRYFQTVGRRARPPQDTCRRVSDSELFGQSPISSLLREAHGHARHPIKARISASRSSAWSQPVNNHLLPRIAAKE